jgi:hypothetical protein
VLWFWRGQGLNAGSAGEPHFEVLQDELECEGAFRISVEADVLQLEELKTSSGLHDTVARSLHLAAFLELGVTEGEGAGPRARHVGQDDSDVDLEEAVAAAGPLVHLRDPLHKYVGAQDAKEGLIVRRPVKLAGLNSWVGKVEIRSSRVQRTH